MDTITIKLDKGEYTNFTNEFDDHDIIIMTGARGAGKSFPCAKYISKGLIDNPDKKFIYMRIADKELATFMSWCNDLNLTEIANGADSVQLTRGKPTKGDIHLAGYDADGMMVFERIIGKCVSLESSHTFKSGKYDDFFAIVFEEYTHLKMNPQNEKTYVFNFLENVVSVFRERDKKIFLMCNNLKNIPLLDRAIDELTGELFINPLKIKIFRRSPNNNTSKFLSYLNGEIYEDDDFAINVSEFFILYTNKDFIIKQHKIYSRKFYITANKNKDTINYREQEFLNLKYFCINSANNEFYYQSPAVEKQFIMVYTALLAEIAKFTSDNGTRFIM